MEITSAMIKELRDTTGISVMQCKKALEEAEGDMEKAVIILKKKRSDAADKKSDREIGAGTIGAYMHNTNEVSALVKLGCETDFVAKNSEFVQLANDIAMHVAAMNPKHISRDEVSEEIIEKAKELFSADMEGKSEEMKEKIMEGKLAAYFGEQILLEQSFVKNPEVTIREMITGAIQKFGENVTVAEVTRLSIK